MKEIGRISADIVTPKCLKVVPVVVPELSPVKTIWLGQVEPEQYKKKNPGKPHDSGVFGHFEVSIIAC